MREILFRGKRMDNGEWVEGWFEMYPFGRWPVKASIIDAELAINGEYKHEEVDHATIGQYTGLTDKNGKKIFEGDIVLVEGRTGTVVYSEENCVWYVSIEYGFEPPLNDYDRRYIKVIGNIHDNRELLEVGNG